MQPHRQVNIIQTSIKKTNKHVEVVKGERSETKELNIHVKTITTKFLLKCIFSN